MTSEEISGKIRRTTGRFVPKDSVTHLIRNRLSHVVSKRKRVEPKIRNRAHWHVLEYRRRPI